MPPPVMIIRRLRSLKVAAQHAVPVFVAPVRVSWRNWARGHSMLCPYVTEEWDASRLLFLSGYSGSYPVLRPSLETGGFYHQGITYVLTILHSQPTDDRRLATSDSPHQIRLW